MHDKIGHYIRKYYEMLKSEKLYKHQPETITEGKDTTILKDFVIQNYRRIKSNRLDILDKDYKEK